MPQGPEAYIIARKAIPIFNHPLATVWSELGRRIYEYFDSHRIKWTSIDPVRFVEEYRAGTTPSPRSVFLWVGVMPGTLSRGDAQIAATRCKEILKEFKFTDVEIAFRESVFTRSVGPRLDNHDTLLDQIPDIRGPFTPALGLRIAPKAFPALEGTGGLYICEGGESDRVFILTVRHVVLPSKEYDNDLYIYNDNGQRRRDVILCGSTAYEKIIESTMVEIGYEVTKLKLSNVSDLEKAGDYEEKFARKRIKALIEFYDQITTSWSTVSQRVLGHIAYAPPISVNAGNKAYIEDWALVELHRDKIGWTEFKGNTLDLGKFHIYDLSHIPSKRKASPSDFIVALYPAADLIFDTKCYPSDDLFRLRGVVKEEELGQPTTIDKEGEDRITVIKNSNTTGVTFGQGTGIESFVREYDDDYIVKSTFMAIAIYPSDYAYKYRGAFSAPGDSGAVVADGNGRIIGVVIGGTGDKELIDVTYLTPYYWIEERIREVFPEAYLYPIVS